MMVEIAGGIVLAVIILFAFSIMVGLLCAVFNE